MTYNVFGGTLNLAQLSAQLQMLITVSVGPVPIYKYRPLAVTQSNHDGDSVYSGPDVF